MECSNCGAEIEDDSKFCEECGAKVEIVKKCPKCGNENPANAKFCVECGESLDNDDPEDSEDKEDVKSDVSEDDGDSDSSEDKNAGDSDVSGDDGDSDSSEDKDDEKVKESAEEVTKKEETKDDNDSKSKSSSSDKLEDNEQFCSNCGEKVPKDSARCIFCGEWLQKPANKLVGEKFIIYSVVLSFILMLTSVYAMYIISTVVQGYNIFAFSILMLMAAIIGVYFVNEHIYVSLGSVGVFVILDIIFMSMMGFLGPITYKTGILFLLFFLIALSINYAQENEKTGLIAMMALSIISLILAISTKDYIEIIILLILIIYGLMTMRKENIF